MLWTKPIRKTGDFADGFVCSTFGAQLNEAKLFLKPDKEVVDAGAAYGHIEVGLRFGHDAESSSWLLDDAFD